MQKQYKGKSVTVTRAARQGDPGFDASKGPQDLIELEDGTSKVVLRSDLT